jgi:hypothetical protein
MKPLRAGASTRFVAAAALFVLVAGFADLLAQRRGGFGGGRVPGFGAVDIAVQNPKYDGRFAFARLKYETGPGGYYYFGLPAWAHGYVSVRGGERAERNLMKIMNEVSYLTPHIDESVIVALDDPALFRYPVAYMTEAGFWTLTDAEAAAFRTYLTKGGFVVFDDFRDPPRGGGGWENFEANMRRVLPEGQFVDMEPIDPIFDAFFKIDSLDIIPQDYDQGRPVIRGIYENNDPHKRLMLIANFNTDISNFWEFSGIGLRPIDESNEAYKLGVNYIIYGMTH